MMVRTLNKYKLVLAVTPRAGVGTVDNIIRVLMNVENPRKWFAMKSARYPSDYLMIKFVRNPFARLVSQYVWHASANPPRSSMTFLEFIDWMKKQNLHQGDDHYAFQWVPLDNHRFQVVKIEQFDRFVKLLNDHGGHSYKVSDFRAGNYKPKVKTEQKVYSWPYRKIFDTFNSEGRDLELRREKLKDNYYLGVDYGCQLPTYQAYYDEEVRNRAAEVIEHDLRYLGYGFDEMKEVSKATDL
jgi:hypothetical protein